MFASRLKSANHSAGVVSSCAELFVDETNSHQIGTRK